MAAMISDRKVLRKGGVNYKDAMGIRRRKDLTDQFARTPDYIYDPLHAEFHFTFDPCPVNPSFDGLAVPWGKRCYVNPPYNALDRWLRKAVEEMQQRGVLSVFLIPFRPHRVYYEEFIDKYASEIRFLKEQIRFVGYKNVGRFGACIIVFRPRVKHVRSSFSLMDVAALQSGQRTISNVADLMAVYLKKSFDFVQLNAGLAVLERPWGKANFICATVLVEAFIDRAGELTSSSGVTTVLLIPLRHGAKYFLDKVMFGRAVAVLAFNRALILQGYPDAAMGGTLALIFRKGPKRHFMGPKITVSDISF